MAGYPQRRESDIKAKIEGYTSVPNEQAHHRSTQLATRNLFDPLSVEEILYQDDSNFSASNSESESSVTSSESGNESDGI